MVSGSPHHYQNHHQQHAAYPNARVVDPVVHFKEWIFHFTIFFNVSLAAKELISLISAQNGREKKEICYKILYLGKSPKKKPHIVTVILESGGQWQGQEYEVAW